MSVLRGELPWWNPYASLGRPFLADLQTAAFYPPTWLMIIGGVKGGWFMGSALHGTLAIVGFLRLMRLKAVAWPIALGGAALYLFSAPLSARMQAGQVNYVYSLCYLPLVLYLATRFAVTPERRTWVKLTVVWALQLLCCHPQVFWLSLLASGLFVTGWLIQPPWKEQFGRWIGAAAALGTAAVTALGLLSFVIVPFFQLIEQSNRAQPSLDFSASFAMMENHWFSLFSSAVDGFAINWEYDLHAGHLALIGGIVAFFRVRDPLARGVTALALGGVVIAAGNSTPLFPMLYKILPGIESFRVPSRAGVLLTLGLTLGATALAGSPPQGRWWKFAPIAVAFAIAMAFVTRATIPSKAFLGWGLGFTVLSGIAWSSLFGSTTVVARISSVLGLAVIGALGMLVALHGMKNLPHWPDRFPAETLVRQIIAERQMHKHVAPVRVSVSPELLRENSGMIYGYATPVGFESLSLARVWNYLHDVAETSPNHFFNTTPAGEIYQAVPNLDSLNLSIFLPPDSAFLSVVPQPDPRTYLVSQFLLVRDFSAAVAAMKTGHPIHQVALLESSPEGFNSTATAAPSGGYARVISFALNTVEVEVLSPMPALLVLAEAWYPGWRAEIRGTEIPCIPANGWMRAVPIPAGRNTIRFVFRQERLLLGCVLSAITAILLAAVYFWPTGRCHAT